MDKMTKTTNVRLTEEAHTLAVTSMSGKVDFVEGLPKELSLTRRLSNGHEFCSRYYNANFIAVRLDQSERKVKIYRRFAFAACVVATFTLLAGWLL